VARAANMTFYVKPSGGSQWSGKSSPDLQTDITATINLAVAGDQIWVASGTYTSPSGGFVMKDGVNVLGGFDGTEVVSTTRKPLTNITILDGNFANKVLTQGAAGFNFRTQWDGFVIQNANTSAVNIGQNATIMNCVVRNNTTTGSGAGIQVTSLTGTAFDALTTDASNRAMIINCVIHNNTAANYGGGIFGGTSTKTFVANSSIVNNSITSASGQGAVSNGSGASFSFVNCILWGNMNNTAVTPTASQAPFGYATFSTSAYQGLSGVLVNLDAANSGSTVGVYYPQFTTPSTTIGSNASSLPSDISVSDWSLLSTSACLDKGLNTSALYTFPTIDLEGNARAAGNYVDLGAIENQKAITSSATTIAACTTTYGTASAARTITVSGANLTTDIIATAPTGFEVSSDGSTYGATAAFTNSGGIASGTLSVRLAASAAISGSYNAQDIVLSSTNCNAVNIVTAASGNTITAKALTITGAATADKEYDGTTTASVTGGSLVGVISPDVVDLVQAGDFDTKNVGTSKTITANCSISGAGAGNYSLSQPTLTARDITAKALTVTGAVTADKEYDGTTTALVTDGLLVGVVSPDVVDLTQAGDFDTKNVGTSKTITSNCSISGVGAGNYTISQPTLTSRDITAKALTIGAASIASKIYDGSATSGTVTAGSLSGFVSPETVTVSTAIGTYANSTVGTAKLASIVYTLANGDNGGLAANYSLANGSATGDITSATTTVDVTSGTPTLASLNLTETSEVTVSGTGVVTFDADKTVRSVTADTGGNIVVSNPLIVSEGVTVAPNATLNLSNTLSIGGDLTLKADQTSTFSVKVGSPMTITGNVKFLKTMDDTQWYFMAFPCNVALSGIKVNGSPLDLGTNFFIKYYSGSNRASNGTGANWIPVVLADDHLIANQGYIFGLPDEVGLGQNVSVITFPLDRDVVKSEAASRTLAVNYYGTLSNVATNLGWNLIGQPFLSKYASQDGDVLNLYRFNGSTYDFYAKNTFNLPEVNPFEAYFTQVNSSLQSSGLTFGLNERRLVHASVAVNQSDLVRLNFSTATGSDKTYLIMDDLQSTSYQIGEDLEKMIATGTTIPQVYSVLGGINYANNALPVYNVQSLPIGFYTQTGGNTTISVDATKAASLSKLLLTDNGTSPATVTDLLVSNYTFTAAAGTNNTRFAITAQRITTEIDKFDSNDALQLSIVNCQLSIKNLSDNATVRVYDALGRMVVSKNANSNLMQIKLNARGIYTVQLQSGTTISTRKVIF